MRERVRRHGEEKRKRIDSCKQELTKGLKELGGQALLNALIELAQENQTMREFLRVALDEVIAVGDHVYYQPGSPVGLVTEMKEYLVFVQYSWGASYWYEIDEVTRTSDPLSQ